MFAKVEIFHDGVVCLGDAVFFVFGITGVGVTMSVVLPRGSGTSVKFQSMGDCGGEDEIGIGGFGTFCVGGAAFSEVDVATFATVRAIVELEAASGSPMASSAFG